MSRAMEEDASTFYWIHLCPTSCDVCYYSTGACLSLESGWRERRSRVTIVIAGSERPGGLESDLVAHVHMDGNAHAHTQTTLRGGQREVYRVTESLSPLALPGREALYEFEPERARHFPLVGWVHLDPVHGEVTQYAPSAALALERAYAARHDRAHLTIQADTGSELDICVHLRDTGQHYQRTPGGYRDVRRLVQDAASELDTISLPVHRLGDTEGMDAHRWRFCTDDRRYIADEDRIAAVESQSLRVHDLKLCMASGPALTDLADTSEVEALYGIDRADEAFGRALCRVTSEVVRLAGRAVVELYAAYPAECSVPRCIEAVYVAIEAHVPPEFRDAQRWECAQPQSAPVEHGRRLQLAPERLRMVFALAAFVHVVDPFSLPERMEEAPEDAETAAAALEETEAPRDPETAAATLA